MFGFSRTVDVCHHTAAVLVNAANIVRLWPATELEALAVDRATGELGNRRRMQTLALHAQACPILERSGAGPHGGVYRGSGSAPGWPLTDEAALGGGSAEKQTPRRRRHAAAARPSLFSYILIIGCAGG